MKYLLVNSRYGEVSQGYYSLNPSGTEMILTKDFCNTFEENDTLEIYLYVDFQVVEP